MTATARYATARTPSRPSFGAQAALYAAALGEPWMPWQRQVADVALELDPDRPGEWAYPLVVVSVPRQSGKTSLMRSIRVHRAIHRPGSSIWMTAQTGKDATKQWNKLRAALENSPRFKTRIHTRRSAGTESITFPTSSFISPFPPTEKGLHGETTNLVDIDEAWSFAQDDGAELLEAIEPTQITIRDRQLWIYSTAGTADSLFLRSYVDAGRAATLDPTSRMAYFEWSAPEDADLYDPQVVASFHPAVGYTQDLDTLMQYAQGSPGKWRRSYCNLWSAASETIVDLLEFAKLGGSQPRPGPWVLSYSAAEDRSGGSLWASWTDAGHTHTRLLESHPGLAWMAPAISSSIVDLNPTGVVADDAGPTRTITAELRRLGRTVTILKGAQYAEACEAMLRGVEEATWHHDGSPQLRSAVEAAVTRPMGAGRGFSATHSRGPIDHLVAATTGTYTAAEGVHPGVQLF